MQLEKTGARKRRNEMKKLIMAASIAAIACGCITHSKNDGGDADLQPKIVKDIVYEKYDVGKAPVTGTEAISYIKLGIYTIKWGGTATHFANNAPIGNIGIFGKTPAQLAMNGAYANACEQGKCDSIVGSRYKIKSEDYFLFGTVTCEASGYPAKLTGVELRENKAACQDCK